MVAKHFVLCSPLPKMNRTKKTKNMPRTMKQGVCRPSPPRSIHTPRIHSAASDLSSAPRSAADSSAGDPRFKVALCQRNRGVPELRAKSAWRKARLLRSFAGLEHSSNSVHGECVLFVTHCACLGMGKHPKDTSIILRIPHPNVDTQFSQRHMGMLLMASSTWQSRCWAARLMGDLSLGSRWCNSHPVTK